MSLPPARSFLANQYIKESITAPNSDKFPGAQLLPTRIKSGKAASVQNGVVHEVVEAAIATDDSGALLAAKWSCGGGSVNTVPVERTEGYATCATCAEIGRLPRGPVVYRCYATDGALLYIGSTRQIHRRLRGHRGSTEWWPEVERVEYEQHDTEAACRQAEARAIRHEAPFYNVTGQADPLATST